MISKKLKLPGFFSFIHISTWLSDSNEKYCTLLDSKIRLKIIGGGAREIAHL